MSLAAIGILIIVAGLMAYVRLAPTDAAQWHIDLTHRPAAIATPSLDVVRNLGNGAYVDLPLPPVEARTTLAKLDAIAMATPRTMRLGGNVEDGHITWETRSLICGFPDYTTAEVTDMGLTLFARQRFGRKDAGVNAARLSDWLAKL
ncbi:MAG: DUF1499 domain-containing protein [Rhodobacteraceae bacterium]|nr:DUF1499 domain-containing protein [Paracoccaceae bacterium]